MDLQVGKARDTGSPPKKSSGKSLTGTRWWQMSFLAWPSENDRRRILDDLRVPLQLLLLFCLILNTFAFASTSRLLAKYSYAVCSYFLCSSHLLGSCVLFPFHSMQDELFSVHSSAHVPYLSWKGESKQLATPNKTSSYRLWRGKWQDQKRKRRMNAKLTKSAIKVKGILHNNIMVP